MRIGADEYMDYLDASETINSTQSKGYKREHIQLMCEWIVRLYGNQFTMEELKNSETGLEAADIIMEFMGIDLEIAEKISKRMERVQKNFTISK